MRGWRNAVFGMAVLALASCGTTHTPAAAGGPVDDATSSTIAGAVTSSGDVPPGCAAMSQGIDHFIEPAYAGASDTARFVGHAVAYAPQQAAALDRSIAFWTSVRSQVLDEVELAMGMDLLVRDYTSMATSLRTFGGGGGGGGQVFVEVAPRNQPGYGPVTIDDAQVLIGRYMAETCGVDVHHTSPGRELGKAEFIARADASCFAFTTAIVEQGDTIPYPTVEDRPSVEAYLDRIRTEVLDPSAATRDAALKSLVPPIGDEQVASALIDGLEQKVAAMDSDPVTLVKELGKKSTDIEVDQPSLDYGFLQCSAD